MIACVIVNAIGMLILSFSVNIEMVIIGNFLGGVGVYPSNQLALIYLSEISVSVSKFR